MRKFGVYDARGKFKMWALNEIERELARKELAEVELLAACVA